jgi:hypothetical protein
MPNAHIIDKEEGEKIQNKGTDNLFSSVIAENLTNVEKGRDKQVQ